MWAVSNDHHVGDIVFSPGIEVKIMNRSRQFRCLKNKYFVFIMKARTFRDGEELPGKRILGRNARGGSA